MVIIYNFFLILYNKKQFIAQVHKENKVLTLGEITEGSAVGEVWQILPGSQETEETSLSDQMAQVITTEETSADGIQQIIYVSYQDPDDPNLSRTLHFGIIMIYYNNQA